MKISQAVELFLTDVRARGLSQETFAWYRKRFKRLVSFFNDSELAQVTIDGLRSFIVSLRDQKTKYENHYYHFPIAGALSDHTVHGYVRIVKRFFAWLEENGHIENNIALKLKKPSLPKLPPKEVSKENFLALLSTAGKTGDYPRRDVAIILFLANTGCRKAGALNLRISDLILDENFAFVTEKGRKTRAVFFHDITKKALQEWLELRPQNSDFVFVGLHGKLGIYAFNQILARIKKRAGIKGSVSPHSFRHFFAKRYLENGGDLASLSDLLGHSSVEVTKNSYTVFLTEELKRKHREHNPLAGLVGDD